MNNKKQLKDILNSMSIKQNRLAEEYSEYRHLKLEDFIRQSNDLVDETLNEIINLFNGPDPLGEAFNSGDGTYKP